MMNRKWSLIISIVILMLIVFFSSAMADGMSIELGETAECEILGNEKAGYMAAPGVWGNFRTEGMSEKTLKELYETMGQEQRISMTYGGVIVTFYGMGSDEVLKYTQDMDKKDRLLYVGDASLQGLMGTYDEPATEVLGAYEYPDGSMDILVFLYDTAEEPGYTPMLIYVNLDTASNAHIWYFENFAHDGAIEAILQMVSSFSINQADVLSGT